MKKKTVFTVAISGEKEEKEEKKNGNETEIEIILQSPVV